MEGCDGHSLMILLGSLAIQDHVTGVDDAGNVAQDGEDDADQQTEATAVHQPDADRWNEHRTDEGNPIGHGRNEWIVEGPRDLETI